MRASLLCSVFIGSLFLTTIASAQSVDPAINEMAMYGIGRASGTLTRYDFANLQSAQVGTVRVSSGATVLGIEAAAYIPGYTNIFGFATDSSTNQNKLIYINTKTAESAVVAEDLEGGPITGAVAVGPAADTATQFDGQDDYIELPHSDAYLLDNGTVMFWFNAANASQTQGLFSKDSSSYDTGGHLTIYLESSRVKVRLQSTSNSYYVSSGSQVESGTWHHVTFSFGAVFHKH